eukprot:Pgem_evm1s14967
MIDSMRNSVLKISKRDSVCSNIKPSKDEDEEEELNVQSDFDVWMDLSVLIDELKKLAKKKDLSIEEME